MQSSPPSPPSPLITGPSSAAVPVVDSKVLMGEQRELLIRHAEHLYRLRITAQGKLILTK